MKKWYEIRAKADGKAEIWVYEPIGEDFWGEGLTAKSFVEELNKLKATQIDLHVNSPGGSVFDGQAMYNALQRHPANVTTYVDGVAASIASVVALAGDEVVMAKNALLMIHDPWGGAQGNAADLRSYADVLDKVRETIVGVYTDKTLLERDFVENLMTTETWMTADEALAYGFADSVEGALQVAACSFEPFSYKHPPVAEIATVEDDDGEPVAEPEPSGEPAKVSDTYYLGLAVGLSPEKG